MQEDTMAMSEDENSDSEVVLLGQSSHLSNLLLSDGRVNDQMPSKREQQLDEQLRALGLYEEYMSVEQKEELLAVVDVSRRTAEQEENRRQQSHSFLDSSQEFVGDEIEFNMQESVWVANDSSFLQPSPATSSNTSPTFPEDGSNVSSTVQESQVSLEEKLDEMPNSEEEMDATSQELFEIDSNHIANMYDQCNEFQETSQSTKGENRYRRRPPRRGRTRRARGTSTQTSSRGAYSQTNRGAKVAIAQPMIQAAERKDSQMLIDMQINIYQQKLFLEKSMSNWEPCMSPVAQPLVATRLLQKEETNVPFICFEEECGQSYLTCFENYHSALCSLQMSSPKCLPWGKPITIVRHSYGPRRKTEDTTTTEVIGYHNEEASDTEFLCELTESEQVISRTSKSAFQPIAKPSDQFYDQSRLDFEQPMTSQQMSLSDSSPYKTTRSGASYGSRKLVGNDSTLLDSDQQIALLSQIECKLSEGPIVANSVVTNSVPSSSTSSYEEVNCDSTSHQEDEDNSLPRFHDLRSATTTVFDSGLSVRKDGFRTYSVRSQQQKSGENSHYQVESQVLEMQEMLDNSQRRSASPHSTSSLVGEDSPINVEAVVDEEIQQFILKRKRLQENSINDKSKNYPVKRLKKNTS